VGNQWVHIHSKNGFGNTFDYWKHMCSFLLSTSEWPWTCRQKKVSVGESGTNVCWLFFLAVFGCVSSRLCFDTVGWVKEGHRKSIWPGKNCSNYIQSFRLGRPSQPGITLEKDHFNRIWVSLRRNNLYRTCIGRLLICIALSVDGWTVQCGRCRYSAVAEHVTSLHMDADIFHTPSQSK